MFQENIFKQQLNHRDQQVLDDLTRPGNWDYARFRKVLVALGSLGDGRSIPGTNAPETIQLQEWREPIADLMSRTGINQREHGRIIFVDTDKQCFVFSGKISVGTAESVQIVATRQPGRERFQKVIATVHTHPLNGAPTAHGLSGGDYVDLLNSPDQQVMVMGYGRDSVMLALKTSFTPNNMDKRVVADRLQRLENEFIHVRSGRSLPQRVVDFNKIVCVEFGMALYQASRQNRDLFQRILVADEDLDRLVSGDKK